MSFRAAARTANKVMERCPNCGDKRPKELVEGAKRVNWVAFGILFCCTLGLGLVLVPLWYKGHLEAYCEECEQTFPV